MIVGTVNDHEIAIIFDFHYFPSCLYLLWLNNSLVLLIPNLQFILVVAAFAALVNIAIWKASVDESALVHISKLIFFTNIEFDPQIKYLFPCADVKSLCSIQLSVFFYFENLNIDVFS